MARSTSTTRTAATNLPALPEPQILAYTHTKKMAVWAKEDAERHDYFLNLLLCLAAEQATPEVQGRKVRVTFEWV